MATVDGGTIVNPATPAEITAAETALASSPMVMLGAGALQHIPAFSRVTGRFKLMTSKRALEAWLTLQAPRIQSASLLRDGGHGLHVAFRTGEEFTFLLTECSGAGALMAQFCRNVFGLLATKRMPDCCILPRSATVGDEHNQCLYPHGALLAELKLVQLCFDARKDWAQVSTDYTWLHRYRAFGPLSPALSPEQQRQLELIVRLWTIEEWTRLTPEGSAALEAYHCAARETSAAKGQTQPSTTAPTEGASAVAPGVESAAAGVSAVTDEERRWIEACCTAVGYAPPLAHITEDNRWTEPRTGMQLILSILTINEATTAMVLQQMAFVLAELELWRHTRPEARPVIAAPTTTTTDATPSPSTPLVTSAGAEAPALESLTAAMQSIATGRAHIDTEPAPAAPTAAATAMVQAPADAAINVAACSALLNGHCPCDRAPLTSNLANALPATTTARLQATTRVAAFLARNRAGLCRMTGLVLRAHRRVWGVPPAAVNETSLPLEIWDEVASYLGGEDLKSLCLVARFFATSVVGNRQWMFATMRDQSIFGLAHLQEPNLSELTSVRARIYRGESRTFGSWVEVFPKDAAPIMARKNAIDWKRVYQAAAIVNEQSFPCPEYPNTCGDERHPLINWQARKYITDCGCPNDLADAICGFYERTTYVMELIESTFRPCPHDDCGEVHDVQSWNDNLSHNISKKNCEHYGDHCGCGGCSAGSWNYCEFADFWSDPQYGQRP